MNQFTVDEIRDLANKLDERALITLSGDLRNLLTDARNMLELLADEQMTS